MVTTAKNKNELIEGLKKEKDFAVLAVHTGPASTVAKEVAKHGLNVDGLDIQVDGNTINLVINAAVSSIDSTVTVESAGFTINMSAPSM